MEKREKSYAVQFSAEELHMIYDVFDELMGASLKKWTTLLPKVGEYRSSKCFQQWLITGMFDTVRQKAAAALRYEAPVSGKGELLKESLFEIYKDEIEKADKHD